ncbi:hypothetical protein [Methyloglobulus sp.]|uniref:hypothetical protein n=1 Tax=Methyloglobulus sp. TaxID=2518622 RepID=UPI0032B7E980
MKTKIAILGIVLSLLMSAVWASESVVGGNVVIDREIVDIRGNYFTVDTNQPINIDGRLTHWEVFAKNNNPVKLVIYRQNNGAFALVANSGTKTPSVGFNRFTLEPKVAVKAGDFVGMFFPQQGSVSFTLDPPSVPDFFDLSGTVLFSVPGANATDFAGSSNRRYSIRVVGRE